MTCAFATLSLKLSLKPTAVYFLYSNPEIEANKSW